MIRKQYSIIGGRKCEVNKGFIDLRGHVFTYLQVMFSCWDACCRRDGQFKIRWQRNNKIPKGKNGRMGHWNGRIGSVHQGVKRSKISFSKELKRRGMLDSSDFQVFWLSLQMLKISEFLLGRQEKESVRTVADILMKA